MKKTKDYNLNVRITLEEREKLLKYCEQTRRTQTEVIRDFIRRLRLKKEG